MDGSETTGGVGGSGSDGISSMMGGGSLMVVGIVKLSSDTVGVVIDGNGVIICTGDSGSGSIDGTGVGVSGVGTLILNGGRTNGMVIFRILARRG